MKLAGADVTGSPAVGVVSPGTSYSLSAGTYVVSEDANTGYAQSFSGACNASGTVVLTDGADVTCTVTNDDIALVPTPLPTPTPIPSLPDTGIAPQQSNTPWNSIVLMGIFAILTLFYFVQKKQAE